MTWPIMIKSPMLTLILKQQHQLWLSYNKSILHFWTYCLEILNIYKILFYIPAILGITYKILVGQIYH